MAALLRRVEDAEQLATEVAELLSEPGDDHQVQAQEIAKSLATTLRERGPLAVQIVQDSTRGAGPSSWNADDPPRTRRGGVSDRVGRMTLIDLRHLDSGRELLEFGRAVDAVIATADLILDAPEDRRRLRHFFSACDRLNYLVLRIATDDVMKSRRPLCANVNGCPDFAFVEVVKAQRCKPCRRQQLLHGRDRPGPNGEGKQTKRLAAAR